MQIEDEFSKDQRAVGDAEQGDGQQDVLALQHLVSLSTPPADHKHPDSLKSINNSLANTSRIPN